jgi:hypothetical protein
MMTLMDLVSSFLSGCVLWILAARWWGLRRLVFFVLGLLAFVWCVVLVAVYC